MKKWIQKILIFLNYIFAVALVFSYLSVHISPIHFWPLAFFGLLYPALLFVNILFLVYWLFKWKKYLLISLVVILAGFNHFSNTIPNPFQKKEINDENPGSTLKILSYNVRAFNIYEWLNDPNTDQGIFNFIRSEHPDVICLQEFYMDNQPEFSNDRFKKLFGETPYSHFEYSFKSKRESSLGLATFSRYPILKREAIKFENTANESMYTDILVDEDTIRIINNHLQSVRLRANNYAFLDSLKIRYSEQNIRELHDLSSRLKQAFIKRAGQAKKVSMTIKNSPHPVIVCGDFNDTPVSYSYHKIRGKLKDAWVESGKGWGNTYSGRLPFRIDFIFYDSYFKSLEFDRVKTQLSDHYPILTVLENRN